MNIGIDIDGVLTNIEKFQLIYGKKHFKDKYNRDIVKEDGYGIKEIFNCTAEMELAFWTKYTLKYVISVPPRKDAVNTIKKLREDGHKIFIISSRGLTTKDNIKGKIMRLLVKFWLKIWQIEYDGITYCSVENSDIDKANACFSYGIDVMIEDKKENIEALSRITNVICFNSTNNRRCHSEKIIRVENFKDVYCQIIKLKEHDIESTEVHHIKNKFKRLSLVERNNLSNDDLLKYYKELKEYYLTLSFDKKVFKRQQKNCIRLKNFLQPFVKFFNQQLINEHLLPKEDGFIVASNHLHELDTLLQIRGALGVKAYHILIKAEVLQQKIGVLFKYIGSIFVNRQDKQSRKQAKDELVKILLHGGNVLIFPEGTINRTQDKLLLDFHYGAVDVAQITGAPIIPLAINKNYKFRSKNLFVRIGEPIFVNVGDDLTVANNKLKDTIGKMILENKKLENETLGISQSEFFFDTENKFKILNKNDRAYLSNDELFKYYEELKKHYRQLSFNEIKLKRGENNYRFIAKIISIWFKNIYNPQLINEEFLPSNSTIFVSNHISTKDTLLISSVLNKIPVHILSKSTLSIGFLGILHRAINAVFVERTDANSRKQAKDELVKILLHGGNVLIFPEGTRNLTKEKLLLDFHYGAVDIAQITGAPIIPIAINKNYKFRSKNLFVRVGEPIFVNVGDDLTMANNKLKDIMGKMILENKKVENESGGITENENQIICNGSDLHNN